MQKKNYDVVIVGAGVSGLMLAKLLNKSKLKVLLIEKRSSIKKLKNYQFGTFGDIVKKFKLTKYVIANYSKFGCYSINEKIIRTYKKNTFQVVDLNKFASDIKLDCDVITNFQIKQIDRIDKKVSINNNIKTKLIVDCSGDQKIVSRKLKILRKKSIIDAYSVSFEMDNCAIPSEQMQEFRFIADIRYGSLGVWFYPFSQTKCQIGLTDFYSDKFTLTDRQEKNLKKYIRTIKPFKTWLENAKITNIVKKVGPTTTKTVFVDDNFLACGDAAGAGTPYIAEGFRIGLEMALSAKQAIEKAFEENDFSKETLKIHEENFKQIDRHYTWSVILRFLMLNFFTTKSYDLFIHRLNKLTNKEYYDSLRSNFTFKIIFKLLTIPFLFNILSNAITNKSQVKKDIALNSQKNEQQR